MPSSSGTTSWIIFQIVFVCCICELIQLPRVASFRIDGGPLCNSAPRRGNSGLAKCPVILNNDSSFFDTRFSSIRQSAVDENNGEGTTCGDDEVCSGGFFWDFQGHSCYAEVAQPSNPDINENRKKPIVILIHGFACSTVYWRETRAYLTEAGYTVHSVDLLGQGKSSKPGRKDNVTYSIDLWAKMVDEYARRHIDLSEDMNNNGVVLVGNSLGSTVALSATTGDCYHGETNPNGAFLPSRVKGLCFYNCGVGLNTRNALKNISSKWLKALLSVFFDVLNLLVFNNKALLTYVIDKQVSKDSIRDALMNLYSNAEDPESRVNDELVDSFINPVLKDSTPEVVEVLSQIYTNDAGRTPMELHGMYFSEMDNQIPIHLIWGDKDPIAPVVGDVGTFYSKLALTSNSGVSMEIVKDAGHVPFDERPECNSGLIKWLAETFEN